MQEDPSDKRRRLASLTKSGQQQYELMLEVLPEFEHIYEDMFATIGVDLFVACELLGERLNNQSLYERMNQLGPNSISD